MATFFDDLGESLSNKYPEILRVLEANEEDSLERFRWSLKESKLIPRFCDSSPKTILNSIVPGCIKCHKGEEEEACLNFLSSLRKASPDLVSTAISLREEWHRLAAVVHGYPCHFLKEETSLKEEHALLSELVTLPAQDHQAPQRTPRQPIETSRFRFADHHDQMVEILASCETETLKRSFTEGLVRIGLLSTAERDQAYKIECPVIRSKAIVSVVAKVFERGVKPHKLLERLLSLLNNFHPELKFGAIIQDLQKKGCKIKSIVQRPIVGSQVKPIATTPHSVPSGNEGCHNLNEYQKYLKRRYRKLALDRDNLQTFFSLCCKDAQGLAIAFDCIPQLQADSDDPPRSLIIGAPGIGKSALVYELCKNWREKPKNYLKEYEYVILIKASCFASKEINDLNDIVPKENKNWVRPIIDNDGENTLIIIDGYDELTDKQRSTGSFAHRLICCETLTAAALIVTTRPWCGKDIQVEFFPNLIEILGFTKAVRNEFISHYAAEKVVNEIDTFSMEGCSFVPFYLSLMIKVIKEEHLQEKHNLKTRTKMYGALIMSIIVNFLRHSPNQKLLPKPFEFVPGGFLDLPRDIYKGFLKLCGDSYKVAIHDKTPQPENNYDTEGYGLLFKQEIEVGAMSESVNYRYLHPSIMEYLAAYAISRKEPEFIRIFFETFKKSTRHFSILEFLSGFGCVSDYELFRIEKEKNNMYIYNFSVMQQLCETESVEVSRSAFEGLSSGKAIISRTAWPIPSFRDFWCLGRILATVDVKWEFGFTLRHLEDRHLEMLLQGMQSTKSPKIAGKIEKLSIGLNSFTLTGISSLCEISKNMSYCLFHLDLTGNHLKSDAIPLLLETLNHLPRLKKLLFHNNEIDSGHHTDLIKALSSHKSINHVSLSNLQEQECRQLLSEAKRLNVVELWQISTSSVKATISAIPESNLDELQFHQSKVTVETVLELPASLLGRRSQLSKLTFSNCGIDSRCATIIASAAIYLSSLDLQNNVINDIGGKELLKLGKKVDLCDSYEHNCFTEEIKKHLKERKHRKYYGRR